ncbi:hypothetical protein DXT66_24770 [Nocardia farcinica]|nr:hypothetical protein DXT66_24770 [Nocardia farcinica]
MDGIRGLSERTADVAVPPPIRDPAAVSPGQERPMTHDDRPSFSHEPTPEQNQTVSAAAVPRPVFSSADTAPSAPADPAEGRAHRPTRAGAHRRRA